MFTFGGMSDILQKTLASLPGFIGASLGGSRHDGSITVGIQTFVQSIIALRSKHVSSHVVMQSVVRCCFTSLQIERHGYRFNGHVWCIPVACISVASGCNFVNCVCLLR